VKLSHIHGTRKRPAVIDFQDSVVLQPRPAYGVEFDHVSNSEIRNMNLYYGVSKTALRDIVRFIRRRTNTKGRKMRTFP
jgi:hypothetical protein